MKTPIRLLLESLLFATLVGLGLAWLEASQPPQQTPLGYQIDRLVARVSLIGDP